MTRPARRQRRLDVLVVGVGQAGLARGRERERAAHDFLLLDRAPTLGHSWRTRRDSLHRFTPASCSALAGLSFPAHPAHHAGKDAVTDYLSPYARACSIPIGPDETARTHTRGGDGDFLATTDHARHRACAVVVATGPFQRPHVPAFAATRPPRVQRLHADSNRNPGPLTPGPGVVVGGGSSGVHIAAERAATHDVTLVAGSHGLSLPARILGRSVFHWLDRTGLLQRPAGSRIGRRLTRHEFLTGENLRRPARAGMVRLAPRVVAADDAGVRTDDEGVLPATTVMWATGWRPSYDWPQCPVLDDRGRPLHRRGLTAEDGLAFLALPWQHSRGSVLLGGVAHDAAYVSEQPNLRLRRPRRTTLLPSTLSLHTSHVHSNPWGSHAARPAPDDDHA